jgi:uncharacterized protein YjbI with pentapeptide repeats
LYGKLSCLFGSSKYSTGKENTMADQSHLDILLQGVEAWNEWREQNPSTKPDLRGADLIEADLPKADLSGAVLTETHLYQANLTGADLTGTDLTGANLTGADLSEANHSGANLSGANLSWADLSGATNLTQDQIKRAHGNEKTKLPEHLKRPEAWSRNSNGKPT